MTGQTITHYRVIEWLGEGASAVVYRAEDLSLGREVVLKFFSPGKTDGARFQHEARTISSLNHPNICTVYEIGEHDGRYFLAMERLDGEVLARTISGRPLSVDRVIDIGTQIADALDAAHAERIVHRDLKPANIFVTRSGRIKLMDFGVALLLPLRRGSTPPGSLTSSTAGTIPYMSPEQAQAEELDHRSDLFSLGIILYEMATGQRPFAARTGSETLSAIVGLTPIPPCGVNPRVPTELDRIILKALEKKPALRYQNASDLKADLQRMKRDLEGPGATVAARSRLAGTSNRSSWWWLPAAAAGVLLLAGAAWFAVEAARARSVPLVPPASPVTAPPVVSTAPVKPPAPAAARDLPSSPDRPRQAAAAGVKRPASPPAVDQFAIARQQIDLRLYDQAIATLRKIADAPDRTPAIDAWFLIASVHETRNDVPNAMSTYVEIASRFPGDARAPEALARLAQTLLKSGRPDKERDALRTIDALVEKYPQSLWAPRALLLRGEVEARQGTYQRDDMLGGSVPTAAVTYRRIAERYPSSESAPEALQRLARIYADTKRFALAATILEQLARRDLDNRYDAWFAAAEIYDKRLKDATRARSAYPRVPPSSPRYADAQQRRQ